MEFLELFQWLGLTVAGFIAILIGGAILGWLSGKVVTKRLPISEDGD